MTKNWYTLECSNGTAGVFNGEVGKIIEITDLDEVVIDFEDRTCAVPPSTELLINNKLVIGYPQYDIQLAYAITVHRAQGSEYQTVVYVINKSVHMMLNRKNIYTAVTRARKKVHLVTDTISLSKAVLTKEPRVFGE